MADFEAIYKEHFLNVYRYVLSLCHNESLAEEITQEAFYKALNGIDRFDRRCQLYVWLCQIAKNTYFTYAKKQQRHTSEAVADMSLDVTSEIEFTLRVFCELPFLQIGELFGKTDSWARLIFYRAKIELRRELDENNL